MSPAPRGRSVAVDSVAFIYFIEEHPRYLPLVTPLFEDADAGRCVMVASSVALLEVLVLPLRAGNTALAERYQALLTRSRGVRLVDVSRNVLTTAAQIRARWAVRTPDAIHLATALSEGCSSFVTNDRNLPLIPGLSIVQLAG